MNNKDSSATNWNTLYCPKGMSDADFFRLSQVVQTSLGIKMPPAKKDMIQARLLRRLRLLGINSFHAYCEYLLDPQNFEGELIHLMDLATTNKTSFFRETEHFTLLTTVILPQLHQLSDRQPRNCIKLWSAGCSSGEEVYTLAMVVAKYLEDQAIEKEFYVLGTDISTRMLEKAHLAIYDEKAAEDIPPELRKKFLLRNKDRQKALVRIAPEIRARVHFQRLNFMDPSFGITELFDVIFLRNVIIYFDRIQQQELINKLCNRLSPMGFFFVGLSETLHGLQVSLTPIGRSVYRKL